MIDISEDEWVPAKRDSDVDEEGVYQTKQRKRRKREGKAVSNGALQKLFYGFPPGKVVQGHDRTSAVQNMTIMMRLLVF